MNYQSIQGFKSRHPILTYFTLYWFGALVITLIITIAIYFGSGVFFPDVWAFHVPWHVLDYQNFGFVRRGLLGTILSIFTSKGDLRLFSLNAYIALAIIFTGSVAFYFSSRRIPANWSIAFLLSPFTFMHFGFDSPRSSELLWLSLTILALVVAETYPSLLGILGTSLICCLSILAYEGSFFVAVPAIAVRILYSSSRYGSVKPLVCVFIFGIPVILTLAVVLLYGDFHGSSTLLELNLSALAPNTDSRILGEVLLDDLATKNYALGYGVKYTWFCNSIVLLSYMVIWLACLGKAVYHFCGKGWCIAWIASICLGMALNIVALDYARYCCLVFFMSSILASSLLGQKGLSLIPRRISYIFSFALILGPVGVAAVNPFPLLKYLAGGNVTPLF